MLDHAEGGLLSAVHLDLPLKDFRNLLKHWQPTACQQAVGCHAWQAVLT